MPFRVLTRSIDRATRKIPVVRRIPAVRLLAAGELAVMAANHLKRLTPAERQRLLALVRTGRLRRSRLTLAEQRELQRLLDKLEGRYLLGEAIQRLSPVPLPRRLVYGSGSGSKSAR
jgi:hypothetical protein